MEKFMEKKNLGIPVTLSAMLAYVIGYYMTNNYNGLVAAILFGAAVFAFDFDDKVRIAVKQSYTVAILLDLLYLLLGMFYQLSNMVSNTGFLYGLNSLMNNFYLFLSAALNIFTAVVYGLFLLFVIMKKDIKLDFILHISGDGKPKQAAPPVYPQPQQMSQTLSQPVPQSVTQPTAQPTFQPGTANQQPQAVLVCPKCQAGNKTGDIFCSVCGTKLVSD